ncbi:FAD-binding domain-containing protein [Xylariaceae sp. FL0804]|nr:FAD-binding domain-containing protein [Xylariaceae sp. FL0804]
MPAHAYAQPSTAQEVADTLAILVKAGAKFAVRTWGHTPNPGFSSLDGDGIVVDLRKLNSLSLDQQDDGSLVRVGAGCKWTEVYSYLEDHQLSATGGRDPNVGVSGFVLGGGYPANPNLHGFGADGVESFEVVLADSSIVRASANEHQELFRALKGGGANFGIVTEVVVRAYPLVKLQYMINMYNPSEYEKLIAATVAAQEAMEKDPKVNVFTNFNAAFVAVGLLYADHAETSPPAFEHFLKLEPMMAVVPRTDGTILSLTKAMAHPTAPGKRTIGSVTTKVSADLYLQVHKAWQDVVSTLPEGMILHYTIQPVATAGVQAGEDRGGNAMGLEKVPQCWYVFTAEWPREGDDAAAHKAVATVLQAVRDLAGKAGLLLDYQCMSFANSTQPVLASYGQDSVRRMKQVAAEVDPNGVFQTLQGNGFLLRNL